MKANDGRLAVAGSESMARPPRVAVVVPCHDEAESIARVVAAFKSQLPEADVVVFHCDLVDAHRRTRA